MASNAVMTYLTAVSRKTANGDDWEDVAGNVGDKDTNHIGVSFENVIDDRIGDDYRYSLDQFYDSYINFIKSSYFLTSGKTQPVNQYVSLWIDTSVTSDSQWNKK